MKIPADELVVLPNEQQYGTRGNACPIENTQTQSVMRRQVTQHQTARKENKKSPSAEAKAIHQVAHKRSPIVGMRVGTGKSDPAKNKDIVDAGANSSRMAEHQSISTHGASELKVVDIKERIQAAEKVLARETKQSAGLDIDEKIRQSALPDHLFKAKNRFSKIESAIALSLFAIIVVVLGVYWVLWEEDYAVIGTTDNIYNFGLVGGVMMLSIMMYAVRKRVGCSRRFGNIRYWYYLHFFFGIVGPVLIVLHTSFAMRSINGSVALIAMFLVVFSGFIGRYLYTRIGYGLRSLERELQIIEQKLDGIVLGSKLPILKPTQDKIADFTKRLLASPKNIIQSLACVIFAKRNARALSTTARRDVVRVMKVLAKREGWKKPVFIRHVDRESRMIREHLITIANIATTRAFEKLVSRWRLLHVPIIYFLLLTTSIHVLAVHMY